MFAATDGPSRRRVLVSRLDSMGDVLLTGPVVRAVAAQAEVVYLTSPRGEAAAALLPGVDEVIVHEAPWIAADAPPVRRADLEALVARIAAAGVDAACILGSSHQSPLPLALLLRLAGVDAITAVSHEYPGSLLDRRVPGDPTLHEVERNLLVATTAGFDLPDGDDGRLRLDPSRLPAVDVPPGAVVVHPGASAPARTWPPARWQSLVRLLVDDRRPVLVTGSTAERGLVAAVAGPGARPVVGRSLAELAATIGAASVVVCGNTGPAHLGAAMGTPVVEVFAPTVPAERWAPWCVPHVMLGDHTIACAGCRQRTCPIGGQPCTSGVRDDDVLDAIEIVLASPSILSGAVA
jgi:ADP-heptose:LPS heptosyltransferase